MKNRETVCRFFKRFLVAAVLLLGTCLLMSCGTIFNVDCPYVLNDPHVELGYKADNHKYAGAYFEFFNDSSKTVKEFSVSFLLFDSDGKSPFIGSNQITSKIVTSLGPEQSDDFIVNLDPYLTVVPSEPYEMDFVFIKKIIYTDGSTWSDPMGMYAAREVEK